VAANSSREVLSSLQRLKVAASTPSSVRRPVPVAAVPDRCVPPAPFLRPRRFTLPRSDTCASLSTPARVSPRNTLGIGCSLQGLPDSRGPRRHRRYLPLLVFSRPALPPQSLSLAPNQWTSRGLLVCSEPKLEPESTVVASVWFPSRRDSLPHGLLWVGPLSRSASRSPEGALWLTVSWSRHVCSEL